jgi:hypothetical protein
MLRLFFTMLLLLPMSAFAAKDDMAERVGRTFFEAILSGKVEIAMRLSAAKVNLDGHYFEKLEQIEIQFRRMSERAAALGLRLKSVRTLDRRQMFKRYGPGPKRIRPETKLKAQFVLARFNRKGAVAILEKQGLFWRVVAVTD